MYKPAFTNPPGTWCEDYTENYAAGERQEHRAEVRKSGSLGVRLVHLRGSTNAHSDPASPDILLGITLAGRARARWSWGGEWYETPQRTRGDFGLTPVDSEGHFEVAGFHQVLVVCLPIRRLKSLYDDDAYSLPLDFGELHTKYRKDPLVFALCSHLWELSSEASPHSAFASDAATLTLLSRLQTLSQRQVVSAPAARPLEKHQVRELENFIARNLDVTITNAALSRHFNIPLRRFQDMLKAATGESPRQFVLRVRVDHALRHIRSGRDLVETAHACGFADQSHLCRVVRQRTGRSPSEFRKTVPFFDLSAR